MKPRRSPRQSTPAKNIGPTRSHLSTRQLPQPRNMGTAWPPWRTMCQLHLQTLVLRTPPARINEVPGNHHGRHARSIDKHSAILHGCRPTASAQHLRPYTAAAHIQQSPQKTLRRRPWQRQSMRQDGGKRGGADDAEMTMTETTAMMKTTRQR